MSELLCFCYVNDFYLSASPDCISEKSSVRYLQGAVLLHSCSVATERPLMVDPLCITLKFLYISSSSMLSSTPAALFTGMIAVITT